jgi:thiamine biosynthesis lipoprotein
MPESPVESVPSNFLWDITRYIVVAVAAGIFIWYYCFYSPITYDSKVHIGETMGTAYKVVAAKFPNHADWEQCVLDIQSKLDAIDQMMTTYRSDSEVCRFNDFASTEDWFPVSQETAFVVHTALEISQLSDGAFDITVAPLVGHWGFGAGGGSRRLQTFEELKSTADLLKDRTGYKKLSVRLDPPALKKASPELMIDLSAIAKGYAVDCVAELLEARKLTDFMIEVGGEVRSKGRKSKDKDWIAGIEKPTPEFSGHQQVFVLGDRSMATSGSYWQERQIDGRRVSHLIDPRTGMPAQIESSANELVAVAVIAPTCTVADAWATAMFVLGEREGVELAHKNKIAVLFLLRSGDTIIEVPSKHWTK